MGVGGDRSEFKNNSSGVEEIARSSNVTPPGRNYQLTHIFLVKKSKGT